MEQLNLNVEMRNGTGKSVTRKLRAMGKLPGVVYGLG
ncbi:MAG: 50S ribosomal protein L25, partial [Proteobacteria bacterium]|nr:50S ribosomal protein L25 [Pseudomonadota bacterium]NDD05725.1 50S ribosomal protein L25 [Pseudomonadota bacterium]